MQCAALQAMIDTEPETSLSLTETVEIRDLDHLHLRGKTITSIADPAVEIRGRSWSIQGGKLRADGGVLFDCRASTNGLILNVWSTTLRKSKEVFRCVNDGSCYDTLVLGGEWAQPQDATVPIVRVEVGGPRYNRNKWDGVRFQTNGRPNAPVIKLACTSVANWLYGNVIRDCNFEIPNAGAVHLESCFQTTLDGINIFDADLYGYITDDLVKVEAFAFGLKSKATTVRNYMRLSGVLTEGKADIVITDQGHYPGSLIVEQVEGIDGAKLTVRLQESAIQQCVRATSIS